MAIVHTVISIEAGTMISRSSKVQLPTDHARFLSFPLNSEFLRMEPKKKIFSPKGGKKLIQKGKGKLIRRSNTTTNMNIILENICLMMCW